MWGAQADPAGSTTVRIAGEGAHVTAFFPGGGASKLPGRNIHAMLSNVK